MVETQEFKVRPLMSYKKPMGDTQEFKARPGGAKIVQVSAEPSLLELCRAQPILFNERIAQGNALGRTRR